MTTINPLNPTQYTGQVGDSAGITPPTVTGGSTLPPLTGNAANGGVVLPLPDLVKPRLLPPDVAGLSLEQLIEALGAETRQVTTRGGVESLKAKAAAREDANKKSIEETQKQLEKMRAEAKLNPFLKALKWIGKILGAIASAITIAVGAVTGNPVMVAAGVVLAAMTINSIVSDATDGKISLAAGFAKLAEKCGASEDVAKWIGFGFEIGITVVGAVMSFGAGFASSAAKLATEGVTKAIDMTTKVLNVMAKVQQGTSLLSGLNTVAQGGLGIAKGVYEYEITQSKASQKELEAILERIRAAIDTETDFLEAIMKRGEELLGQVKDIVDGNNQAQAAILTNQAPGVA
jgi:hypothetical protein